MNDSGKGAGSRTPPDLQAALERLERAIRRVASQATGELAGRAAAFLEEAAVKLEMEIRGESAGGPERPESRHSGARRSGAGRSGTGSRAKRARRRGRRGRREAKEERRDRSPTRKLYRDPEHARIAGVCAGIARYFGAERWVTRCIAITGLIFMPSIVFPAYWILYFVLRPAPGQDFDEREENSTDPADHSSPAPELGPKLSPRRSLSNLRAGLEQAELRLRRIETHVTSGQYELQKELNKLA